MPAIKRKRMLQQRRTYSKRCDVVRIHTVNISAAFVPTFEACTLDGANREAFNTGRRCLYCMYTQILLKCSDRRRLLVLLTVYLESQSLEYTALTTTSCT